MEVNCTTTDCIWYRLHVESRKRGAEYVQASRVGYGKLWWRLGALSCACHALSPSCRRDNPTSQHRTAEFLTDSICRS